MQLETEFALRWSRCHRPRVHVHGFVCLEDFLDQTERHFQTSQAWVRKARNPLIRKTLRGKFFQVEIAPGRWGSDGHGLNQARTCVMRFSLSCQTGPTCWYFLPPRDQGPARRNSQPSTLRSSPRPFHGGRVRQALRLPFTLFCVSHCLLSSCSQRNRTAKSVQAHTKGAPVPVEKSVVKVNYELVRGI